MKKTSHARLITYKTRSPAKIAQYLENYSFKLKPETSASEF